MSTYLKNYDAEKRRITSSDLLIFDWDKAVQLIKKNNIKNAKAGLKGDWLLTNGLILKNGKPVKEYTYLSSPYCIPILRDLDSDKDYECFLPESETEYNFESTWNDDLISKLEE